jgi:thiamine biosynthesis lipoprotein
MLKGQGMKNKQCHVLILKYLGVLTMGFFLFSCDSSTPPPPVAISGKTMGTLYTVKVSELPKDLSKNQLHTKIEEELERVNNQMSTYRPDSEISRFNKFTGQDWFEVSRETAEVVDEALLTSRISHGAFDITVSPLINLWGFGPKKTEEVMPGEKEIHEAMTRTGYQHQEVRLSPPSLRKSQADLQVNLSAIAKGFGVDQIAELLERLSIHDYLVEIGGEIRSSGSKKGGSDWTIGIETPIEDSRRILEAFKLGDRALATSGDYRNYFEKEGKRYSHTIDPKTGRPIEHRLASVSVIDETCMKADAMATAMMVLGPKKGYELATKEDLAAMFLVRGEKGFVRKTTPLFDAVLSESKK